MYRSVCGVVQLHADATERLFIFTEARPCYHGNQPLTCILTCYHWPIQSLLFNSPQSCSIDCHFNMAFDARQSWILYVSLATDQFDNFYTSIPTWLART